MDRKINKIHIFIIYLLQQINATKHPKKIYTKNFDNKILIHQTIVKGPTMKAPKKILPQRWRQKQLKRFHNVDIKKRLHNDGTENN